VEVSAQFWIFDTQMEQTKKKSSKKEVHSAALHIAKKHTFGKLPHMEHAALTVMHNLSASSKNGMKDLKTPQMRCAAMEEGKESHFFACQNKASMRETTWLSFLTSQLKACQSWWTTQTEFVAIFLDKAVHHNHAVQTPSDSSFPCLEMWLHAKHWFHSQKKEELQSLFKMGTMIWMNLVSRGLPFWFEITSCMTFSEMKKHIGFTQREPLPFDSWHFWKGLWMLWQSSFLVKRIFFYRTHWFAAAGWLALRDRNSPK